MTTEHQQQQQYRVKLVVGDWSKDGHELSEDYHILSNLTGTQIEKAYKKGTKLVGFDFAKEVCAEYEDSSIPKENWEKLKSLGYAPLFDGEPFELEEDSSENGFLMDTETFCDIFLFVAKLGNPNLEFQFVKNERENVVHVGGYGLFH